MSIKHIITIINYLISNNSTSLNHLKTHKFIKWWASFIESAYGDTSAMPVI